MGGIARKNKIKAVSIGGVIDHVHMLMLIPASISIAKAVQLVKGGSSKWLHENDTSLKNFAWQEGYGAFSIHASQVSQVVAYIASQEEHHRIRSFQEEYLSFLKEYNVEYDERYVWGRTQSSLRDSKYSFSFPALKCRAKFIPSLTGRKLGRGDALKCGLNGTNMSTLVWLVSGKVRRCR
jgi:putative transposase